VPDWNKTEMNTLTADLVPENKGIATAKALVALSNGDLTTMPSISIWHSCIESVVIIGQSNLGYVERTSLTPFTHICPHVGRSHKSFHFA
jgi:hypothetical protein